jgi:hypothetical protein
MQFDLYYSTPFRELLAEVYDLEEIAGAPGAVAPGMPLLRSRKPFKGGAWFDLPFGFRQTADWFKARWRDDPWPRLSAFAAAHGADATLTTVGRLDIERGFHAADNPVLWLPDGADPRTAYSPNLRANLRKEWNKARRHGIEIARSVDPRDLRAFHRVLATQYVREHRMVFQPLSLFAKLMEPRGHGVLFVAKHQGAVVGGIFLIADGPVLHYNWGARASVGNVSIGTLLVDHAIEHARAAGHAVFDFGGTPLSDTELKHFKMRWGCVDLPVYTYHTSPAARRIDLGSSYAWPRKEYSKIPVGIAQALMPVVVPWLVA